MEKTCRICHQVKMESDFTPNKAMLDGLASECRICKNYITRTKYYKKKTIYNEEMKPVENEIFMPIHGFDGYFVSNLGRIYSDHLWRNKKGRFLIFNSTTPDGYHTIRILNSEHKFVSKTVHLFVADAFLPKIEGLDFVNHINGIKTDNRVENLERCTNRENVSHRNLFKNKTSKYIGVRFNKKDNRWYAAIKLNGKYVHLGCYKEEYDAHLAYKNFCYNNGIPNRYLGG